MTLSKALILIILGLILGVGLWVTDELYVKRHCDVAGTGNSRFGEMVVHDCGWATFRTPK